MADRERIPNLSKSRFMAGLQCHKRLYLALYQAGLAEAPGPGQQAILDQGTQVGVLARGYVPGGVLIDEDSTLHDAAMAHTRQALADAALPALYEAAFAHDEVAVRVDLLLRAGGNAFDVIEVKSSTQVKEEHLWDLAIQAHVLEGAGLEVRNYAVLHINRDYVYPGGEHDLRQLFALAGVSDAVRGLVPRVPELLAAMREPLWAVEPPPVETGDHCHAPYDCPFIAHCHAGGPEHPVGELPRAGKALRNSLANDGIGAVPEIPADYPGLTDLHARVREAVVSGRPYHDPAIGEVLRSLEHPLHFLDFETINPAVPLYPGTRPYDQIPFQWSLHRLDAGGAMSHSEFLHDGPDDPRPQFTTALVQALGERGAVCVYHNFEATQLRALQQALPDHAPAIEGILSRLVDLLPPVREHVYHPEFHGSFSLKRVLPALLPGSGYDDLAITDGSSASAAYLTLLEPSIAPGERDRLRQHLLDYCGRDTEALLELYRKLS